MTKLKTIIENFFTPKELILKPGYEWKNNGKNIYQVKIPVTLKVVR